jgi:glycyl-tRNA synthetase beta chain
VKTIAEYKLPLTVTEVFKSGLAGYPDLVKDQTKILATVFLFMLERIEFYLREARRFPYDSVRAVMASSAEPNDIVETIARAEAVTAVRGSEDFEQISVAFKRIRNILSQARQTTHDIGTDFDVQVMSEKEERALAEETQRISPIVEQMRADRRYSEALLQISKLRPLVDRFFDKVMVMVEDRRLRQNRLALLAALLKNFSTIADFSEIVTEGQPGK